MFKLMGKKTKTILNTKCFLIWTYEEKYPGLCYKTFSCSTQLSMKFIMLINVKMPTTVGMLTFISMINRSCWHFNIY